MIPIPEDREERQRLATNLEDTFRARADCPQSRALGALINLQPEDAQRHLDAISDDGLQDVATAAKVLASMAQDTFMNRGTP